MGKALFFVAAALALGGCDSRAAVGVQPTVAPNQSPLLSIQPDPLVVQPTLNVGCPGSLGFTTTFQLVVIQPTVDLFLDRVQLQFFDGSGIGRTIPFMGPNLVPRFGPTIIPATATRAFSFTPLFGCTFFVPRSLSVMAVLVDRSGKTQQSTMTASVK